MSSLNLARWDPERADDLRLLLLGCIPYERFFTDELASICWEAEDQVSNLHRGAQSTVLGTDDGRAAVAICLQRFARAEPVGVIRALAVHPYDQGTGSGRELLTAAVDWLAGQGAQEIRLGAGGPRFLWPGVDTRNVAAMALLETAGFVPTGAEFNLALGNVDSVPRPEFDGELVVHEVQSGTELAGQTLGHCADTLPLVVPELSQAIAGRTALALVHSDQLLAYGFHSANRRGWIGPIQALNPDSMGVEVSSRFLARALIGHIVDRGDQPVMCWVGPLGWSMRLYGGQISAVYRRYKQFLR